MENNQQFWLRTNLASAPFEATIMGLPISQWIIDLHRGRIWLEHSGSEGSTFCFSLPRQ